MIDENEMTADEFAFFKSYLQKTSGYELHDERKYLLVGKAKQIMRKHALSSFADLQNHLATTKSSDITRDFIDVMTINETSFFRDGILFDTLKNTIFPSMIAHGKKTISVLCAGCSSGQEPYSIAMILEDMRRNGTPLDYRIHGVDISHAIIDRAKSGTYSSFEMKRGLPDDYKDQYFTQNGDVWRVSDELQKRVTFSVVNLADDFAFDKTFDIVLVRNVLIYFSDTLKEKVLENLAKYMNNDGYLGIGSMERISTLTHPFTPFADNNGFHRKKHT